MHLHQIILASDHQNKEQLLYISDIKHTSDT